MSKPKSGDEITLTLGSKYRIWSLGSREERIETRGTFKGIVSMGTVDAMAIELESGHKDAAGKLRLVPTHVVLALDIIEQAAKEEKAKEDLNVHYT